MSSTIRAVRRSLARCGSCALLALAVAAPAAAAPKAETNGSPMAAPTWKELPTTARSHPFGGDAWSNRGVGLAKHGYVEDEYLVSGKARVYDSSPATDFAVEAINRSSYTTRAIVRRPKDMRRWSGDVVVEYMNVSDGLDLQILWTKLHDDIFDAGDVYVAFTGKPNVFPVLKRFDEARYGALDMRNPVPAEQQTCGKLPTDADFDPNLSKLYENGLVYDIWSGIGLSLKAGTSPLRGSARRVYATGESQSANALLNYYKWFGGNRTTFRGKPVYDGNFAETPTFLGLSTPRPGSMAFGALNQCSDPLPSDDPQVRNVPSRGTPFFTVNSQWDAWPDTPAASKHFRAWHVAGADHVDRAMFDHVYPVRRDLVKSGAAGPDALPWQAGTPLTLYSPAGWRCDDRTGPEVGMPQAQRKAWWWLKRWATNGDRPPVAPYLARTPDGALALDGDGNARGGLRLPYMVAPIAHYLGVQWGDCAEAHVPLAADRLAQLYSTHEAYVERVSRAARKLVRQGFLRRDDAGDLVDRAEARPIP